GQFAEQLHANEPAADDHEGELAALPLRVSLHVGALEPLDDVIAEQESVGEVLECEGMLRAGDHASVGHASEGEHELVVSQFIRVFPGGQANYAPLQVDALDPGFDEARGPQERADREGAMAEIECSGTDLEEQRGHDEEIVAAHKHDLDILPAFAKPLQVTGRIDATESAAEDHNPGLSHCLSPG